MRVTPPVRSALIGAVALLVLAEVVARLQGDRLCSDVPGVVYERDAALGWRHVPDLSGRLGTCETNSLPVVPIEIDADGLVGPRRPVEKPPGTARILLLGGNVPEGFGLPHEETMAHLLEVYADERQGDRLEVLNAATGGWALDNGLAFFRRHGASRSPDLVLVAIDPKNDVVSLSPSHLAALGRRVPAKPYFGVVDGRLESVPPFSLAPGPPPPAPAGPFAWSALYRMLRGEPRYVGEPMAWAASGTFPHGTVEEERARSLELARAILGTLRDEVAAAGGRLVLVVMPLPGAFTKDAVGLPERQGLTAIAGDLGIPLLDVSARLSRTGAANLFLPDSLRLTTTGHALAAALTWTFLRDQGLLPPGVVPARVGGGGRRVPDLAALPGVVAETLWSSRHWLIGRFIQFGLLAVCLVWMTAPLPRAARDWVIAALGVCALAVFAGAYAAAFGALLAVACYSVVELLPRSAAAAVLTFLLMGLIAAVTWISAAPPREPGAVAVFVAVAANVALLKLIAYAVDRRRGAPRLPLGEFLAGVLFFPTLAAGPIQAPTAFAATRAPGGGIPPAVAVLAALGRVALGWLEFTLPPFFLAVENSDVFLTGGAALGRGRLWLFVAEVAALLTLLLAGWSNVAIGLARLAGATPPENLRRPWLAPSIAEFWRRWHASLTDWWRAYLYMPMGGSRRLEAVHVLAVFVATAAWHAWAFTNVLGWGPFTRLIWAKVLLCALLNAGGVIVAHALAGRTARLGALATLGGVAATAVFVALAWLPIVLPHTSHLRDLMAVYLRLFGMR